MNIVQKFKWFKREIEYLFTRKKYKIIIPKEVEDQIKELDEIDPEFMKAFSKMIKQLEKNPYIGEQVEEDEL